ncbi:MAG TPA: hypothetical protein VNJ07_14535 [Chitinophagales bacterium]|nr:hypothetical protein [Chitinophagales bacterium]
MKKQFILAIAGAMLLLAQQPANGQLIINGTPTNFFAQPDNTSGNPANWIRSLGIGYFGSNYTNSLLHIDGKSIILPQNGSILSKGEVFRTDCPDTTSTYWRMFRGNDAIGYIWNNKLNHHLNIQAAQSDGNIDFYTANNNLRVRILPSGLVGINVPNPLFRVDVIDTTSLLSDSATIVQLLGFFLSDSITITGRYLAANPNAKIQVGIAGQSGKGRWGNVGVAGYSANLAGSNAAMTGISGTAIGSNIKNTGVAGRASTLPGQTNVENVAVEGRASGQNKSNTGVYGQAEGGMESNYGVRGEIAGPGAAVTGTVNATKGMAIATASALRAGFRVDNPGIIETAYGLYIEDVPARHPYAIWQDGQDDVNYFAGSMKVNNDIKVKGKIWMEDDAATYDLLALIRQLQNEVAALKEQMTAANRN